MATKASFSRDPRLAPIARILSHAPGARLGVDTLKTIAMFCGAALVVLLLLATYGLDLASDFSERLRQSSAALTRVGTIEDADHDKNRFARNTDETPPKNAHPR